MHYCLTGAVRILSTISFVRSAQARIGSPSAHLTSTDVAPSLSMSTLMRPAFPSRRPSLPSPSFSLAFSFSFAFPLTLSFTLAFHFPFTLSLSVGVGAHAERNAERGDARGKNQGGATGHAGCSGI